MENNRKKILLVEDEAIIAIAEKALIEQYGFEVSTLYSGNQVIDLLEGPGDFNFDLVLMDIDLGSGLDGTEIAVRILEKYEVPIVFLTSHSEKEIVEKVKDITRYGYVLKNAGEFVLLESINMAFELFEAHLETKQNREKYQNLVKNSNEIIAEIDANGIFTFVSDQHERELGYTREELLGTGSADLLHPEDLQKAIAKYNAIKKEVTTSVDIWRMRHKAGHYCTFECKGSVYINSKGEKRTVVISRNITGQKESEEELKAIYNNSPVILLLLDKDIRVLKANLYSREYTNSPLSSLTGERCGDFFCCIHYHDDSNGCGYSTFCPGCQLRRVIEEAFKGNNADKKEITLDITKGGEEKKMFFLITTTCLEHSTGPRVLAAFEDITNLKKTQVLLEQNNRALRTINGCNHILNQDIHEQELLERVCYEIIGETGYKMAWIGTVCYDRKKSIRPVAHAGFEEGYLERVTVTWSDLPEGNGPTGISVKTGRPSIMANILTDPRYAPWREAAAERGYKSSIAIPLKLTVTNEEPRVFAVLNIYADEMDAFAREEVGLLTELADTIARRIQNIRIQEEKKRTEQDLGKSEKQYAILLKEKELLLKEVHHRMKNDMNKINSILAMGILSGKNKTDVSVFKEAQQKIAIMGRIYRMLYSQNDFFCLRISDFLNPLIDEIEKSAFLSAEVTIQSEITDISIPSRCAFPVGIIVNELITNAYKYAFNGMDKGIIEVCVTSNKPGCLFITVNDDGIGIPDRIIKEFNGGFGLTLVSAYVQQSKGRMQIKNNNGTEVSVVMYY